MLNCIVGIYNTVIYILIVFLDATLTSVIEVDVYCGINKHKLTNLSYEKVDNLFSYYE